MSDYLDTFDDPKPAQDKQRREAVDFARLYVATFETNPSGKKLLDHWVKTIARRRTPVGSSADVYSRNEALREFIFGISEQIALVNSEG